MDQPHPLLDLYVQAAGFVVVWLGVGLSVERTLAEPLAQVGLACIVAGSLGVLAAGVWGHYRDRRLLDDDAPPPR